jgi:hypothetical protein
LGIASPPVATTRLWQLNWPWLVASTKRAASPSPRSMPSSLQGIAQLTWPSSHSARSMSMMSWAESSQNSWPCSRSCQAMPWRLTSSMKCPGV